VSRNRTLACVFAHPDDDAYGAAGSVALHADDPDFRFVLIHATGLPDGGVAEVPFDDVVSAVARILDDEDPAVVVTFGPDGIFGHPDHVAIGAATDEAFHRVRALRSGNGSGFQRLLHGAVPTTVFERWNRQRAELGLYTFDPTQTYHMRGIPDEQIRVTVDCREVASRIVAGLREHESQLHVMSDDPTNTAQWERRVGREWYAMAWPERERGAPMLTDLFEALT
jgi:LmbE family N-acetylglucosaminyl deacetylase